jgi:phosphoribosyl-AMP cyclohydrolase
MILFIKVKHFFKKGEGIVPVIVQDYNSKEGLTLTYTNKESLELTKKIRGIAIQMR